MTDRCRSCQADVVFVPSAKSGKAMILDATPRKGVVIHDAFTRHTLPTGIAPDAQVAEVVDVFTDHHATCPDAARYR